MSSLIKGSYPSEQDLAAVECWAAHAIPELFEFIKTIWSYPDYIETFEKDGFEYIILGTGGWSGNEDIIASLKSNFACWSWSWYCSYINGTHCFKVNKVKTVLGV